jgi:hypothetical protein
MAHELARRPDELQALSRLAFDELAGFVGGIGAIQRGVAQRAFGAAGTSAKPATSSIAGSPTPRTQG